MSAYWLHEITWPVPLYIKSFSLCIFLLLSLASPLPYMVLVYLLPSPSFKCNRLFHLKMCWFCKTPLSQNWGGHFCPAESKEKSPSRRSSVGSVMQECLSARAEDATTILIGGGGISSRSNFYQPPPPHIPLPRIKQSPAQALCTLTDESRFMCVSVRVYIQVLQGHTEATPQFIPLF